MAAILYSNLRSLLRVTRSSRVTRSPWTRSSWTRS
eukprot:CAMPEP_0198568164 /NCGR_PEP_ID=MMETSP1462-20131121/105963_1 /TAXON_ID=1333877 /ORGANISM="Brandtodinium nutriculum, Strain RCC3387" /LENGTH=34 /DNA_ID= /DNA_START= /DNA_END= /DNA_ORIENTATION=